MGNRVPIAIVLSNLEAHDKVPDSGSTAGLPPLLELGLEVMFAVVKDITRADGRLKSTSIWGSGEEHFAAGQLTARREVGVEEPIDIGEDMNRRFKEDCWVYCRNTMVMGNQWLKSDCTEW